MSAKKIRRIAKREAENMMSSDLRGQQNMEEQIEDCPEVGYSFEALFDSNGNENVFSSSDSDSEEVECNICELLGKWASDFSISFVATSNTKTQEVQQCRKTIGKLTEEVIAVKLENRKHHNSTTFKHNAKFDKLPFYLKVDLNTFNDELEKDEELLDEFKNFIGKVGGDGQSMFLRCAIRKVFTDELAPLFSWKGTNEKPSSEKFFITTVIKNICHLKYKAEDKELNSILQKHFAHSKERLSKRKRN